MNIESGVWSQNSEQGVINSLFGDTGRFLDVGAFDGKTFSNTLRLYERGWSGVLYEPSPAAFAGLKRQYEGMGRVELINKAVTVNGGDVDFFDCGGDAISSTSEEHKNKWEKGYKCSFTKISVQSVTLNDVMDTFGSNFDFVNIDVEGENYELLLSFPFNLCLPMCMCIEFDFQIDKMMKIFEPHGYRIVYQSGENIVVYRGPR